MEKAANFYTAYLTSDDSSVLLSPAIQSAIDGQLQVLKKQISYKRYIVTEIIPNDRRPTRKQDQLITKPTKDFMDVKELLEYEDYVQKPTNAAVPAEPRPLLQIPGYSFDILDLPQLKKSVRSP